MGLSSALVIPVAGRIAVHRLHQGRLELTAFKCACDHLIGDAVREHPPGEVTGDPRGLDVVENALDSAAGEHRIEQAAGAVTGGGRDDRPQPALDRGSGGDRHGRRADAQLGHSKARVEEHLLGIHCCEGLTFGAIAPSVVDTLRVSSFSQSGPAA